MSQETHELDGGLESIKIRIEEMERNISRPIVVGIAGGSGSGKTSRAAKRIQAMFPGSKILGMDDYFFGRQFMESINSDNWDEPRAQDLELIKEHLGLLKQGLAILKPTYSFKSGEREGWEEFKPSGIIILEGLHALCDSLADEADLKVFVEISIHGGLIRRLLRDVGRTGQRESDIFKQYVETVYPMYKLYVEPTKSRADIVIVNQYVPRIEARNCESREIQIKVLPGKKISKKKLKKAGFKKIGTVLQEDTYYLAPGWEVPYPDELMRIRKESGKYYLAYKGPSGGGLLGIKPKIEFEVEPSLANALEKLGYNKALSFTKKRTKFLGRGLELMIDDIEGQGCFLEFRAPTSEGAAQIINCLEELGIKESFITKKSYLEIMQSV